MASTGKFLPQQTGMDAHNNNTTSNASKSAPQSTATTSNTVCFCCDRGEKLEYLDYDYTYDDTTSGKRKPQPYPRIRERGEFYIDTFNDQPWACTFGTWEHVRIFMVNRLPVTDRCIQLFKLTLSRPPLLLLVSLNVHEYLQQYTCNTFLTATTHITSEWDLVQFK
jgi:hypothetical protein